MLTIPKRDALGLFLAYCAPYVADLALLKREATEVEATMKSGKRSTDRNIALERRWYASLIRGEPDYSIYDSDDYLAELWGCWQTYSKMYLRLIAGLNFEPSRVCDLGCGVGFSTAALVQMYPQAEVTGTNMKDTIQWRIAGDVGRDFGFRMAEAPAGGLVFASEYFEHFDQPIEHLKEVLATKPEILVVASTFTQPSIGHFPAYNVAGSSLDGRHTGKVFEQEMKKRGYGKLNSSFWNNRPAVWVR